MRPAPIAGQDGVVRERSDPEPGAGGDPAAVAAKLATSESRYRSLVHAISSLVWITGPDGRIVEPLPGWEAYTGQRYEQYRGIGWHDAIHPDDQSGTQAFWRQRRPTGSLHETTYRLWHEPSSAYRHVVARGGPRRGPDGEVLEWVGVCLDVHERHLAEVALEERRLADAGLAAFAARLVTCATVEAVSTVVIAEGSGLLGASLVNVALRTSTEGDQLRLVHSGRVDAAVTDRYDVLDLGRPTPLTDAARLSSPVFVAGDVIGRRYPDLAADAQRAGLGALAAVPLIGSSGTVLGALGLGWFQPVAESDRMASRAAIVADMVAVAISRAQRLEQATSAARLSSGLARAVAAIAAVPNATELADRLPGIVEEALGCTYAGATIVERRRPVQVRHSSRGVTGGIDDAVPSDIDLSKDTVAAAVTRDGTARYYPSLDLVGPEFPHLVEVFRRLGVEGGACVPMCADDEVLGTVSCGWHHPVIFDSLLVDTLQTLAGVAGVALQRTRLHDAEHIVVSRLQDRLLRQMELPEGLTGAVRYLPASLDVGMGGDWYQAVPLPGGRVAVVVGDVSGHGVEAAADMAYLQASLRAVLSTDPDPVAAIDAINTELTGEDRDVISATVLVAVLDPEASALTHLSAGHPPFLIASPGDPVTVVEEPRRPLVGLRPAHDVAAGTTRFGPGAVLVAYTDGLVERRDRPINDGIAALVALLERHRDDGCEELADAIVEGLDAPDRADDLAVLVVRRAL